MEKRVLLAIALCFLTLYLWQTLVVKQVVKPAVETQQTAEKAAPVSGTQASAVPAPAPDVPAEALAAPPLVGDTAEREVRVETSDVIAVFTNRGARLKSWRLKHYLDQDKQPQELIVNLDSNPLPFTLRAADDRTTAALNGGLYAVSGAPSAPISTPVRLRFEYSTSGDGLHAVKEFELSPSGYIVTFTGAVTAAAGGEQ